MPAQEAQAGSNLISPAAVLAGDCGVPVVQSLHNARLVRGWLFGRNRRTPVDGPQRVIGTYQGAMRRSITFANSAAYSASETPAGLSPPALTVVQAI